jgi:hypothetical protein
MRPRAAVLAVGLLLAPAGATAELVLPPGFTAQVYVTGDGFDQGGQGGARGIPSVSTAAFDQAGALYLARTGRRYAGGEADDLAAIYRVPAGGARLTPDTEARYFHGPPLPNPQVAAVAGGEVFVTTHDRDRKVGVLYRLADGRVSLVAGGTPTRGGPPLFRQPEGAAIDRAGNVYVADRDQGIVVRLGPGGQVLDPRYVAVRRPRVLAIDALDQLWIGADGNAEAPWQPGPGEIWRVAPGGVASLVLRGPVPAGMALSPDGIPFVADRQGARLFVVGAEGDQVPFAEFTRGDAPRSLAFAPVTPGTRRAGFAGELFLIVIRRGAWTVNEVVRIAGPFATFTRQLRPAP